MSERVTPMPAPRCLHGQPWKTCETCKMLGKTQPRADTGALGTIGEAVGTYPTTHERAKGTR